MSEEKKEKEKSAEPTEELKETGQIQIVSSGGRVSNAWVTCLVQGDNSQK